MIDKESSHWKQLPWWFRMSLAGSRTKRSAITAELVMVCLGLFGWFVIEPYSLITPVILLFAYLMSWVDRYGDIKKAWD